MNKKPWITGLALLCASVTASADVRLPRLIDDGMVLQRNTPVTLWGWADAGEEVSVHFLNRRLGTTANDEGRWELTLKKLPAGGPHELVVRGNNEIRLQDVLVGDVWLASGQSNMELTMARVKPLYEAEMARADYPDIRYFEVPDRFDFNAPQDSLSGGEWQTVTPETLPGISALSYFFARDLHRELDVPVGVINAALGGSPAEAWLSEDALQAFPSHLKEARRWRDEDLIEKTRAADQERAAAWYKRRDKQDPGYKNGKALWAQPDVDDSDWETIELPGFWGDPTEANGVWWLRKTIDVPESWAGKPAYLELGRLVDADETYLNGEQVGQTGYQYPPRWYPLPEGLLNAGENTVVVRLTSQSGRPGFVPDKPYELRWKDDAIDLTGQWRVKQGAQLDSLASQTFIRWKPMGLYNGMIAPLTDYALKGVIWYQGESNVGDAQEYADLFPAVIEDWRNQWDQPQQPFLFVQLANYLEAKDTPEDSDWARLREAQDKALALPETGMAVAIDVGEWNDIHPLNKEAVGSRLALAARAVAYNEKDLVAFGPRYRSHRVKGERVIIRFDSVGGGLESCNGEPLAEFAIAGEGGDFVWADARIKGKTVVVSSEAIEKPTAVRYAWADNPDEANLCNAEGLPAAPFRTDSD